MMFLGNDIKNIMGLSNIPNTTTIGQLTPDFIKQFEGPINILNLEPGKEYGPYYRVDSKNWEMTIIPEGGRWFGSIRPESEEVAQDLYKLPPSNLCDYVHEIYFSVPQNATGCVLFWGKVKDGTGNADQYNLNNNGVKMVITREYSEELK